MTINPMPVQECGSLWDGGACSLGICGEPVRVILTDIEVMKINPQ